MAKIIRMVLIVVISIAASTATTVLLMLHYSKPLEGSIAKSNTTIFQQMNSEKESIESVEMIIGNIAPLKVRDEGDTESVRTQPDNNRYFDYALLSKDLAVFSEKVSRFNEVLSREIQKLRKGTSVEEKTFP